MRPSRFTSEKRNYRRLDIDCPVSYQLENSSNAKTGTCINLSADGILFECDDKLPVGSKLKINVTYGVSPSFTAMMEVIRVIAGSRRDCYQMAGILEDVN